MIKDDRLTDNKTDISNQVRDVRTLLNGDFHFFVPYYQRGYRWGNEEIIQLLEDMSNWGENGKGYFLQLLVVCKAEKDGEIVYNIVDGQQRLTTIILFLKELCEEKGTLNHIGYARGGDGSADARFRANAEHVISEWIRKKSEEERDSLKEKVLNAIFLYYEVPENEEMAMFQQLNTWRIPATDAELVKCIILSRGDDDVIRRRAQEWNMIEQSLQNNSLWGMLGIAEKSYPSRMEAFIKSLKKTDATKKFPLFASIEKKDEKELNEWWQDLLEGWEKDQCVYGDALLFNFVGWINNCIKKRYIDEFPCDPKLQSKNLYLEDTVFIRDYLLLANVAYSWQNDEYYDFYRHVKCRTNSIEHIHARNQERMRESVLKEILEKKKYQSDKITEIINEYRSKDDTVEAEDYLADILKESYPEDSIDNSIGNLALLTNETNAAFNNGTFIDKQHKMMERIAYNGEFVPKLTQAVFRQSLNGLSGEKYWTQSDREIYKTFMTNIISIFLEKVKTFSSSLKEMQI